MRACSQHDLAWLVVPKCAQLRELCAAADITPLGARTLNSSRCLSLLCGLLLLTSAASAQPGGRGGEPNRTREVTPGAASTPQSQGRSGGTGGMRERAAAGRPVSIDVVIASGRPADAPQEI